MNNSKKIKSTVIIIIAFVLVMAIAIWGYNYLSKKYTPESSSADISENSEEIQKIQAPNFTVYDNNGNTVKLSDLKGKPVILNFWATWCGPCKSELPAFDKMYEKYKDKINFMMINLTDGDRETKDAVMEFVLKEGYSFPVYYDTTKEAAYAYGTYSIPVSMFIDKDGYILGEYRSVMSEALLEAYIKEVLKYMGE